MTSPVNGVHQEAVLEDDLRIEKNAGLVMAVGQPYGNLGFAFGFEPSFTTTSAFQILHPLVLHLSYRDC